MRAEYDFSNAVKNPYVKPRKTAVTIRLDPATVEYFKSRTPPVKFTSLHGICAAGHANIPLQLKF